MKKRKPLWNKDRKKVIFFGASKGGECAYRCLSSAYRVLAFADNDTHKQGKSKFGIPIIKPAEIACYPFDFIYISCESNFEVYLQLLSMGIDANKIQPVDPEVMQGYFELSKIQAAILLLAIYGLGHIIYNVGASMFRIIP